MMADSRRSIRVAPASRVPCALPRRAAFRTPSLCPDSQRGGATTLAPSSSLLVLLYLYLLIAPHPLVNSSHPSPALSARLHSSRADVRAGAYVQATQASASHRLFKSAPLPLPSHLSEVESSWNFLGGFQSATHCWDVRAQLPRLHTLPARLRVVGARGCSGRPPVRLVA